MHDTARHERMVQRSPGAGALARCGTRVQGGMTVLELLITMAVIGFLVLIGYNAVRYVTKSDLREDTTQIAAVLRAAYNMATTSGVHHRVVFNLDEQTYKIEMCEGDIALKLSEREQILESGDALNAVKLIGEEQDSSAGPEMKSLDDAARAAMAAASTRVGAAQCKAPELPTGDADGRGAERRMRTDRGLKIRSIVVQHLEGEQRDGIVHVNFFPLGRAEKAVIEVGDEDGESTYTLLVHGLTGRVEFAGDRVDPDDHMHRRADGEKVDER